MGQLRERMLQRAEGPEALQTHDIVTLDKGRAAVRSWTNDDRDLGSPNVEASWEFETDTVEQALQITGTSRIGISGVRVTVTLDGERI